MLPQVRDCSDGKLSIMFSTGVVLLPLLWLSLASASHFIGGVSFFKTTKINGVYEVEVRNRATFRGCGYQYGTCRTPGTCGHNSQIEAGVIDSSPNAPTYGTWCQTETVVTKILTTDRPFSTRESSCCWISLYGPRWDPSWSVLTKVDLGTRSDTNAPNNSPATAIVPFLRVPQNCKRSYRPLLVDPEGDVVRCRYGNRVDEECEDCRRQNGFQLNEATCTLHYNPSQPLGVRGFELVVEDFPRSNTVVTYSDGTSSYRQGRSARRKRWAMTTVTAAPMTTTAAVTTTTAAPTTTTAAPTTTTAAPTPTTAAPTTTTAAPTTTTAAPTTTTAAPTTTTAAPTTTTAAPTATTAAPTTTTAAPTTTTPAPTTTTAAPTTTTAAPTTTTAAPTTTTAAPTTTTAAPTTTTAAPTTTTAAPTTTTAAPTTIPWWWHTTTTPWWWQRTTTPWWWHSTTTPWWWQRTTTPWWWQRTTTPWWWHSTTTPWWWQRTTTPWWWHSTTTPWWWQRTTTPWWWHSTTTPWWWQTTTTATTTTTTAPPTTTTTTTTPAARRPITQPFSVLPLQFAFRVDPRVASCTEGLYLPKFISPTPQHGDIIEAEAGRQVEINVKAQAAYSTVDDLIMSGPLNISKHRTTGDFFVIKWTPIPDDVDRYFPICFVVEFKSGSSIYQTEMRCVLVKVLASLINTVVTCKESSMIVEVEKATLPRIHYDHLSLADSSNTICSLQTHSNSTHVVAIVPLNRCGTKIEEDDDDLIFKNEITTVDRPSAVITRRHQVEIKFECQYAKKGNVTISFNAHRKSVEVWDKGFGKLTYGFEFYPDARFSTMIDPGLYPLEVSVGERIYMKIEANTTADNTELFVLSCSATPYDIPNYHKSYTIIENGCHSDPTLIVYPRTHKRMFQMSIEAFKFIGLHEQVYISCTVLMCEAGNPNTRCARGCQPVPSGRRKREAAIETGTHYMSQGPLRLRRSAEAAGSTGLNMNLNLVFIAGCALAAVGMICGVIFYKAKRSNVKYHPLPLEES